MNNFQLKTLSLSLSVLIATSSLVILPTQAAEWKFTDTQSQNRNSHISKFFYVGQGEVWNNVRYTANYNASQNVAIIVKYDEKPIFRTTVSGLGEFSFSIPNSSSGFHRLDFIIDQPTPSTDNLCSEPTLQITSLEQAQLSYTPTRNTLRLSDLPDALYNSKKTSETPLQGFFEFNESNIHEQNMMARLVVGWDKSRPIHWLSPRQLQTTAADYKIQFQKVDNLNVAKLELTKNDELTTLLIQYTKPAQLESAVNTLLQAKFRQQLTNNTAEISSVVAAPLWATARTFSTLADHGIQDFRVDQNKYSFNLNYPAVWKPIDSLSGQISLRSQGDLLEGSAMTAWINGNLAGSMRLAGLDSETLNRQFDILGAKIEGNSNFNLSLENAVITNSQCLPNVNGAVWVNTEKSTLNLPYELKHGVISLSSSLAGQPTIAINDHPNTTHMAATAMQTAKQMLLTNEPVELKLVKFTPTQPEKINIRIDDKMYQQLVQHHTDLLYAPTAGGGFFVILQDESIHIVAADEVGSETFNQFWPNIQNQIQNNVSRLFVSSEGQVYILEEIALIEDQKISVQQSNSFIYIIIALLGVVSAFLVLLWRKRKNEKNDKQDEA